MKDASKAGKIYLKVAANFIFEDLPGMSEGYYKRLLDKGNYYDLETKLSLESYLRAMAAAFSDRVSRPIVSIPCHLDTIILESDDPDEDLRDLRGMFYAARITNGEKGEIALDIIEALHNLWVVRNKEHFHNGRESRERFRFMPLELIGIDRVLWYYQRFLEPLLSVVHLTVDASYIERGYIVRQETFFLEHGIRERDTLRLVLARLDYGVDEINTAMRQPETIAAVTAQVISQNQVLL